MGGPDAVAAVMAQLDATSRRRIVALMTHLAKVAAQSAANKMTARNLGMISVNGSAKSMMSMFQ